MLRSDFCVMRREGSSRYDYHCKDWKDGKRDGKYREGDWKLYRFSDISERPFDSDLVGNNGLRDHFARRQEMLQREQRERQERNAADLERLQYEQEQRSAAEAELNAPPPYEA